MQKTQEDSSASCVLESESEFQMNLKRFFFQEKSGSRGVLILQLPLYQLSMLCTKNIKFKFKFMKGLIDCI